MNQISPMELQKRLNEPGQPAPLLLDVREPYEFAYCHIEGSLNIPMNSVPVRIGELDSEQETVVICHHGMRSASVASYLLRHDFQRILNLSGGVDAWAILVQPDMPRY